MSQCWSLVMTYTHSLIGGTHLFKPFSSSRVASKLQKLEGRQCYYVLVNFRSANFEVDGPEDHHL
jgi:hypothetical protein